MNLFTLKYNENSNKNKFRKGRGHGSGNGKTSGRGHKGQKARSGGGVRVGFEGGQMPLYRRIPKRGFTNYNAELIIPINVSELERFDNNSDVTIESLIKIGILKNKNKKVKILGNGVLTKKLNVKVNAYSKVAIDKIVKNGGKVETI